VDEVTAVLQDTVMFEGAVITGSAAGLTSMVLETGIKVLPQASVAVQVSVTSPPHGPGFEEKVDILDMPLIRHSPLIPLVKMIVRGAGIPPQDTVMSGGGLIAGSAAGLTVIVLLTGASVLPHKSVAVQVSVIVPPHLPGVAVNVEGLDVPLIKQPPVNPLVKVIVLGTGTCPHDAVSGPGTVMAGITAGLTVIALLTGASVLPQRSVAVQVSIIVPPHGPGVPANVDGLDVPVIRQPAERPFENEMVEGTIAVPHGTDVLVSEVMTGKAAGSTVIVLETGVKFLPQLSVAVQVSVIVPPHGLVVPANVDGLDVPVIWQPAARPFENEMVDGAMAVPHGTDVLVSAVITGNAAGSTVIVLETGAKSLPQLSVAVQVSVIVPPHGLVVPANMDGLDVPMIWQLPERLFV
jgi:hypothetical protein